MLSFRWQEWGKIGEKEVRNHRRRYPLSFGDSICHPRWPQGDRNGSVVAVPFTAQSVWRSGDMEFVFRCSTEFAWEPGTKMLSEAIIPQPATPARLMNTKYGRQKRERRDFRFLVKASPLMILFRTCHSPIRSAELLAVSVLYAHGFCAATDLACTTSSGSDLLTPEHPRMVVDGVDCSK